MEKKALDVVILDMRKLVAYTDLFVICSATNPRQARAIAEEVRRIGRQEVGKAPEGVEGEDTGKWVLLDFGSVVFHVFHGPLREFYDLERLWLDAPRIEVPANPQPGDTAWPTA